MIQSLQNREELMTIFGRSGMKELCLALAMFFNPLGYDLLFGYTFKLTGGYWSAVGIFYGIAIIFLMMYFILKKAG